MPVFDVSEVGAQLGRTLGVGNGETPLATLRVSADIESIRYARDFVKQTLDAQAIVLPTVDDAVLIVSELLTNAVLHGSDGTGSEVMVRLVAIEGRLRIEVHDESPLVPFQPTASNDAEDGRGLVLVGAMADRWGCELTAGGKFVWCELIAWPEQTTAQHA